MEMQKLYLLVPLAPLFGAIVAGLFCGVIPRWVAHTATILGVAAAFVASVVIFKDVAAGNTIATVTGRYYTMDRDKRWERTLRSFDAIAHRRGPTASSAVAAIQNSYDANVSDEFIEPVVIGDDPEAGVRPGDSLIFFNFRADRMRQIVQAFVKPDLPGFAGQFVPGLHVVTYTEYMEDLPVNVVFGKEKLRNTLAEVVSSHGLKQYHSAETEKYPHVTFFFNGRNEEPGSSHPNCTHNPLLAHPYKPGN